MLTIAPSERTCRSCGETKPFSCDYFYRSRNHKYGLSSECKECTKGRSRDWISKNKGTKSETDKSYAQKNRSSISAYQVKYRAKNKEKASDYAMKYAEENKEKLKASRKIYSSRPDVKKRRSELQHKRRRYDAKYRLMCNVRSSVSEALSNQKGALRLLSYSVMELANHLEKQFLKGMTWGNYGTDWHVDHIVPASSFDFENADDPNFKFCWALSNLRPLWANENLKKNAKRIFLI